MRRVNGDARRPLIDTERIEGARWRDASARRLYESWTQLVASKQLMIDAAGRSKSALREERLARLRAQLQRYLARREAALRRLDETRPPARPPR